MKKEDKSLKQKIAQFEEIMAWFDSDDVDIEAAIAKFEESEKLAEEIKQQLENAKNRIEIVKQKMDV
jgi:Exonuclease VII small subunit.